MIRLHVNSERQTTFPQQLCDWLGVKAGDDVVVEFEEGGRALIKLPESAAGMLAQYARPVKGRSFSESVGEYVGGLDEKIRRDS